MAAPKKAPAKVEKQTPLVKELLASLDKIRAENSSLKNAKTVLDTANTNLKKEVGNLENSNRTLTQSHGLNVATNDRLTAANSEHLKNIAELQYILQLSHKANAILKEQRDKADDRIDELNELLEIEKRRSAHERQLQEKTIEMCNSRDETIGSLRLELAQAQCKIDRMTETLVCICKGEMSVSTGINFTIQYKDKP